MPGSLLNNATGKETPVQVFFHEFCKIFQHSFFWTTVKGFLERICEHLGTTLLTGKKLKINGKKRTGVFIVNLEQIYHIFLPFPLLILNK